jgi:hypothetical protein
MKRGKLPRRVDDMAMRKVGKMLKGLSGSKVVFVRRFIMVESPTQKLDVPNTVSRQFKLQGASLP